jgi:hypothetical protein
MSKIKQDVVRELHKPARKHFLRRRVILKGIDDLWQMDLADVKNFSRVNRGYKYILVVIDCFSKYLWTLPVKNKTATEIRNAFNKIITTSNRKPSHIQSDDGLEFFNKHFSDLMKKNNINHYSTFTAMKASIAERVIRTLKDKLYRQFSLLGKYRWIDHLQSITNEYNNTKHRTIQMKPSEVTHKNEKLVLKTIYNSRKNVKRNVFFHVGDIVRISKYKGIFAKSYTPNWSTELFNVVKVNITNPPTYLLEDMRKQPIRGMFYTEELQKAKHKDVYLVEKILRRKKDKLYIKWLGLDKSHNSWIQDSHIV